MTASFGRHNYRHTLSVGVTHADTYGYGTHCIVNIILGTHDGYFRVWRGYGWRITGGLV